MEDYLRAHLRTDLSCILDPLVNNQIVFGRQIRLKLMHLNDSYPDQFMKIGMDKIKLNQYVSAELERYMENKGYIYIRDSDFWINYSSASSL